MEGLGPVTLIVKAPNQKVEDKTVDCDLGWTVRELKAHLSGIYPEKPSEDHQKLVYYGKLLTDESCLKDVLTQVEYDGAHVVHLVCHQSTKSVTSNLPTSETRFTDPTEQLSANPPVGIRHRTGLSSVSEEQLQTQPQFSTNYNQYYQQYMAAQSAQLANMTPQQRLWMQTYYQQMASMSMQVQQGAFVAPDVAQNVPDGGAAPAAQPQRNQPVQDENIVRMNAAVGAGGDVDDEPNNDWLDKLYTFARLCTLLIIIYFYSSFGRFSLVIAAGVLVYLIQGNFFRLERRRVNPAPAAQRQRQRQPQQQHQPQQPQQPQQQPQQQAEQNNAENQNNENAERNSDSVEEENTPAPEPDQPAEVMGTIRVFFTFIVTFFSSLVPQNPAAAIN